MISLLRFIHKELLYNGHLQALGAVGIVSFGSIFLYETAVTGALIVSVYCSFLVIFLHDRYVDIRFDRETNPRRVAHMSTYASMLPFVIFILIGVVVGIVWQRAGMLSSLMFLVLMYIGSLYPTRFKPLTRHIPLFKNVVVASVYVGLLFIPGRYYGVHWKNLYGVAFVVVYVFVESVMSQIALDMKDGPSDKKRGLKTLPALVGTRQTAQFLQEAAILFGGVFVLLAWSYDVSLVLRILVVLTIMVNLVMVRLVYDRTTLGYAMSGGKFLLLILVTLLL